MKPKLPEQTFCTGCKVCSNVCPQHAIVFRNADDGFWYPDIDQSSCISCLKCEHVCPINNFPNTNDYSSKGIIVKSINEEIRMMSSSGGTFSIMASFILKNNGVVVGAAFSDDFYSVKHIIIESNTDLSKLRCSKYLQSDMGNIYKLIKETLIENRPVLFSGTGCQVAALKNYLGTEYENLYLIDVVCHGVPSQTLWSQYLSSIENKYNKKSTEVNFRSKRISWIGLGLEASYGENVYFKELKNDPYLIIFQKNLSLRESCYHCTFKSTRQISDISIGDLWAAEKIAPEFNDDKGISFLLINSEKGQRLFQSIKNDCLFEKVDLHEAIANNGNIARPTIRPEEKDAFNKDFLLLPFEQLIKKYSSPTKREIIKSYLDRYGLLKPMLKAKYAITGVETEKIEDKNLQYGLLIVFESGD